MFASKDVFLKSSGGGYTIARSVRLRSGASAYLNRLTTASFTSQRIFTFSFWCKRGTLSTAQSIFDRNQATNVNQFAVGFNSDNTFQMAARTSGTSTVSLNLTTSAVFRDPSAWYHMVIAVDNTQATLANRGQIYVNGVLQALGTQTATQNVDYHLLTGLTYDIGRTSLGATQYFDGYFAEFNFIDGQQLTPSSFGAFNIYGVWQPKQYTGTYGTNGFYLNFKSFGTAAALGTDSSGNSNTWTVNNINVTAYSGSPPNNTSYDAMQDTPTLTSLDAANYATLNPLIPSNNQTVSNGNLNTTKTAINTFGIAPSTISISSGLWYVEFTPTSFGTADNLDMGIIGIANALSGGVIAGYAIGQYATGYSYTGLGRYVNNNATVATYTSMSSGNVLMMAIDLTSNKLYFGVNGTWVNSGNPAAGTGFVATIAAGTYYVGIGSATGGTAQTTTASINFGQRPFSYTAPTGFVALNTYNLSTPTIANGAAYMAATTYTGTGAALTVANTVNGTAMQPDWVWIKKRSAVASHTLFDINRGATIYLSSDSTSAEATAVNSLTAFNSNGFTLGNGSGVNTNDSGATYVGWQWKANGAGVSNTSGTITSTVSAGVTAGFAVVTYTGTGAAATVGHGLGAVPSMIIVKKRSGAGTTWAVYNVNIGAANSISLNSTAGSSAQNYWNSTTPTSSVWSMTGNAEVNGSAETYVAYCFAPVAGYSAFGSYAGNSATDGPFIYLGFKPRWIMIKNITTIGAWLIIDTSRQNYNVEGPYLVPNTSDAETTGTTVFDLLSNGFKCRSSTTANSSGSTYIYMCFAENPFKYSLAR
jgi:hypothetical protein